MRRISIAIAAALGAVGCFRPMGEAGTAVTVPVNTSKDARGGVAGVGFKNLAALGIVPNEGFGPSVRVEGLAGYDSLRGTEGVARVFIGAASVARPPARLSLEIGGDVGSRLDGGWFQSDLELGARAGAIIAITQPRALPARNDAFVFLGTGIDLVPSLRAGWVHELGPATPDRIDLSLGLNLRYRIWTDLF